MLQAVAGIHRVLRAIGKWKGATVVPWIAQVDVDCAICNRYTLAVTRSTDFQNLIAVEIAVHEPRVNAGAMRFQTLAADQAVADKMGHSELCIDSLDRHQTGGVLAALVAPAAMVSCRSSASMELL